MRDRQAAIAPAAIDRAEARAIFVIKFFGGPVLAIGHQHDDVHRIWPGVVERAAVKLSRDNIAGHKGGDDRPAVWREQVQPLFYAKINRGRPNGAEPLNIAPKRADILLQGSNNIVQVRLAPDVGIVGYDVVGANG